VWTTCLVFFQSVLLAGYAYADWTTRLGARRQAMLHVAPARRVAALAADPRLERLEAAGRRGADHSHPAPAFRHHRPAYFLLSTTTPLLQAWYWRRFRSVVPYRLFALSNFASLLALLGFPVLFEPAFDLKVLGWGWSFLFAGFAVLCGVVALMSANGAAPAIQDSHAASKPTATRQLLWLALSAMGSVMLLAVTNHITQNIASVPFLWVVPLALYLVTFILAFDHPRWYRAAALPGCCWSSGAADGVVRAVARACTRRYRSTSRVSSSRACSATASWPRLKPDPAHLTRFYLMISLGGALGAGAGGDRRAARALGLLRARHRAGLARAAALRHGLAASRCWAGSRSRPPTVVLVWRAAQDYTEGVRVMERDFYGVVRTVDHPMPLPYRSMYHGSIMHGGQLLGDSFRNVPADYFGPGSGYGRVFGSLREMNPKKPLRVGVIGLGAGVIASWMKPGDALVFYEISPRVVDIAKREFTFLHDTSAKTELVMGDGRLSLEREPPRGYDVMGIDAFSGDSIPMHLVTREAMELYVKHLKPDGVIVFQATNRFIDLLPVVKRLAASSASRRSTLPIRRKRRRPRILVFADRPGHRHAQREAPRLAAHRRGAEPIADRKSCRPFTDSHHNLLRILK
jgi:hypothetical protein